MKRHMCHLSLILGTILFIGCQSEVTNKNQTSINVPIDSIKVETVNYSEDTINLVLNNDDEEISAFGKIIRIEDGPYPMFSVTIFQDHGSRHQCLDSWRGVRSQTNRQFPHPLRKAAES